MHLVTLADLIPDAIIDQRYATTNNVTGTVLYDDAFAVQLDLPAANQLVEAAAMLRGQDLRLVLWDAYRPEAVQVKLLATNPDTQYVLVDSNHCRGLAVDVTLAWTNGEYLDMGTDYDNFSALAHPDSVDLTPEQHTNRTYLADAMTQVGFTQWPYEWWHFDYLAKEQ